MSDRAASNANDPDAGSTHARPVRSAVDHTHDPDLRSWVASASTTGRCAPRCWRSVADLDTAISKSSRICSTGLEAR